MSDIKTELNSIQEAYLGVITEGKEAKFKVGDKVGIGYNGGQYSPYIHHDTGEIAKIHGSTGHYTVKLDNQTHVDDLNKPYTEKFDGLRRSLGKDKRLQIKHIDDHNLHVKNSDYAIIHNYISDAHKKLSKEHVAHIKSLLDKHTEE